MLTTSVAKAYATRATDLGSIPHGQWIFFPLRSIKNWRYTVSAWTGRPGVCILGQDETEMLMCMIIMIFALKGAIRDC